MINLIRCQDWRLGRDARRWRSGLALTPADAPGETGATSCGWRGSLGRVSVVGLCGLVSGSGPSGLLRREKMGRYATKLEGTPTLVGLLGFEHSRVPFLATHDPARCARDQSHRTLPRPCRLRFRWERALGSGFTGASRGGCRTHSAMSSAAVDTAMPSRHRRCDAPRLCRRFPDDKQRHQIAEPPAVGLGSARMRGVS